MRSSYTAPWSRERYNRKSHMLVLTHSSNDTALKKQLHAMVIDSLSRNDTVVYSAERDTREAVNSLSRLATARQVKPVQKYLANESLIIVPRDEVPTVTSQNRRRRRTDLCITNRGGEKTYDLAGAKTKSWTIIRDPTVLAEMSSMKNFVEFERESARDIGKPVNVICVCQNSECIGRLSFSDLISVISAHTGIIHDRWWYRPLSNQILLEVVRDLMVGVLGNSTIELVFKTLNLVYGLNEEVIILNPSLFESKLGKLLGSRTAQMVFQIVAGQIREEFAYRKTTNERDASSE